MGKDVEGNVYRYWNTGGPYPGIFLDEQSSKIGFHAFSGFRARMRQEKMHPL
jgi:hypothetical protein